MKARIIIIATMAAVLSGCGFDGSPKWELEKAYFDGQREALEGDVRIKQDQDGCWHWRKSPWNDGTEPSYNPSLVCSDTAKAKAKDDEGQ